MESTGSQERIGMSEFEATIEAKKLKHAISALRRVHDESIFKVGNREITSKVIDPANAIVAQVTIAYEEVNFVPEPHTVGINLDKMVSILKRATAKDIIRISEFADDTWFITRGIHRRSMRLLEPKRLRKCPDRLKMTHTSSIRLSGKEFKDSIGEAGELDSGWILLTASGEFGLIFQTESNEMNPDIYTATLPADRFELRPDNTEATRSLYALEYLQDIAKDMRSSDEVMVSFGTDLPCEIEYTRDGVAIWYMLAPRIESD